MAHSLSLEITDGIDCSTLIIRDASVWDITIPIQNAIVEVQTPLSDCFYSFPVGTSTSIGGNSCGIPGFGLALSCAQLEICCSDCPPSSSTLPDGNYNIKFSVDPNLKTMVEFNYFRNCELYTKYIAAVCGTRKMKCDLRPDEYRQKILDLRGIKELIDGAKWSAEECLDVKQALDMYNEAITLLQQYNHTACL